ncbi:MAG: hypothetical protein P4L40_17110 [Terracidiphilus sp.]|nr:hypothetical protein [Terracidiphilus sp.]
MNGNPARLLSMAVPVVALLLGGVLTAAPAGQQTSTRPDLHSGGVLDTPSEQDPVFAARRRKALNDARQKKLVEDTNKLLKLAQELDAEVQTGTEERITAAQNARLAQIEKLAREVRDKMAESDADIPWMHAPITPVDR